MHIYHGVVVFCLGIVCLATCHDTSDEFSAFISVSAFWIPKGYKAHAREWVLMAWDRILSGVLFVDDSKHSQSLIAEMIGTGIYYQYVCVSFTYPASLI